MGVGHSHAEKEAFERIRQNVQRTTLAKMMQQEHIEHRQANEIKADDTVESAVSKLAHFPGRVAVVVRKDEAGKKEIVGVFDVYIALNHLVSLYRGALEKVEQKIVHRQYDPWFWGTFDEWVEKRTAIVPSLKADAVVRQGAAIYFSETVGELLEAQGNDYHAHVAPLSQTLDEKASVADMLSVLRSGSYSSLMVRTELGLELVHQQDLVTVLYHSVLDTRLQGLADLKIKHLHLLRRTVQVTQPAERALLAMMRMNQQRVSALPIIDGETGRITSEFSIGAISAVRAENFDLLLKSVGSVLKQVDPYFNDLAVAVTCSSAKGTIGDVIELMWKHHRGHVWMVDKYNACKGVVSLRDLLDLIHTGVLRSEQGSVPHKRASAKLQKKTRKSKSKGKFVRL